MLKSGNEYRIKGKLNLSRCFGDAGLKECMSAVPDIHFYERKLYKRIVLATDGFYKANKLEERLGVGSVK